MICFIISGEEFDKATMGDLFTTPKCVHIGSVYSLDDAYKIADNLPCPTRIKFLPFNAKHVRNIDNQACFIVCK